jgi:sulfate adenylyltransferase
MKDKLMKIKYSIDPQTLQDCINLSLGVFDPLDGFMNSDDYHSVIDHMLLANGEVWTIPLSFDVDHITFNAVRNSTKLFLYHNNNEIGFIEVADLYEVEPKLNVIKVFNTSNNKHPGVMMELKRHKYRVGGKVTITDSTILNGALNPSITKKLFNDNGWKTIAGFQTRNPIHKAHEYLQRVALEVCDALFINPLVGWKKKGDFSEQSVVDGYQAMMDHYYKGLNIHFDTIRTPMRYAGPREAIFHAIVRRNLGCTHFIIGRDHAGVGDFYGKYEAHQLAKTITSKYDIGINLLLFSEPFYCHKCEQIVSDRTCDHEELMLEKISGTKIRAKLLQNQRPSNIMMRKEVSDSIIKLKSKKFIKE